jgi:3-phenylpropionate/trans-cinnamate dioxygenase ferredoxin reductase component
VTQNEHDTDRHDPIPRIVVIGASHSAVHLADQLRAGGIEGSVTLISAETDLPYQRPPLSKEWLKGGATADSLLLRDPEHYTDNRIELVLGTTVETVERDGDRVVLRLRDADGDTTRVFDRLVLATGARARKLAIPGAAHQDVLVLRELEHARILATRVGTGPVVVIGGGFVGLEVAATLKGLGTEVTVVEAGGRLMGRAVGTATAGVLLDAHRAMGTEVLLDVVPERILVDADRITGVELADGRRIAANTVLVGVGAEPRTELAEQLGLACDGGIVVDDRCVASDGTTIAIGDCTVQVASDGSRVRLESVDNAVEQANTAAATLLDQQPTPRPAPWFWSDQGAWKLQIVGRVAGHHSALSRTDATRPNRVVTLYFVDDALVGAECLNAPADFVALRSALGRGHRLSRDTLANRDVPLKKLLAPMGTG